MLKVERGYRLDVSIPQTVRVGAKVFLPDIAELRNTLLMGIEAYTKDDVLTTDQGLAILNRLQVPSITLTLVHQSDKRASHFPFSSLVSSTQSGLFKEFSEWEVNWQKSYFTVVDPLPFNDNGALAASMMIYYKPAK